MRMPWNNDVDVEMGVQGQRANCNDYDYLKKTRDSKWVTRKMARGGVCEYAWGITKKHGVFPEVGPCVYEDVCSTKTSDRTG